MWCISNNQNATRMDSRCCLLQKSWKALTYHICRLSCMLGVYLVQAICHPAHLLCMNPDVHSLTLHPDLMPHLITLQQHIATDSNYLISTLLALEHPIDGCCWD